MALGRGSTRCFVGLAINSRQAQSLASIHDLASAAHKDGLGHRHVGMLAGLGASGAHRQNIERDLRRKCTHMLGINVKPLLHPVG
eukprot:15464892-Alexandrium_andersonii.AAC.1